MPLYFALVHFPVLNKNGDRIASAITPLDLHDLARLGATYNARRVFIITPLEDQQRLADRVLNHWLKGYGGMYNPDRRHALERVCVVSSLEKTLALVKEAEGVDPLLLGTDARVQKCAPMSFERGRELLAQGAVAMLVFGTAWGLHEDILSRMDGILPPIPGVDGYNHLSVRTAAAIIVDRLAGERP